MAQALGTGNPAEPTVPGEGKGGLLVLLPAGGHRLESKLSLQRDTHIPAPRVLCKHNCQTWFLLLSSWAWAISPFSNR